MTTGMTKVTCLIGRVLKCRTGMPWRLNYGAMHISKSLQKREVQKILNIR